MYHRRVDPGIIQFLQHILGREVEDLAMARIRGFVPGPNVNLSVDDQHAVPSLSGRVLNRS
jgi:hypothetical protein